MDRPATPPESAVKMGWFRHGIARVALAALLPLAVAAVKTSVAPRSIPPHRETGRIVGTVEISTALVTRRPRFRIYADAGPGSVPPPSQDAPAAELRNVVVYVESGSALADSTGGSAVRGDSLRHGVMSQTSERFEPHVLAVLQGGRVDFPNSDDVYHNVFSLSSVRTFDLGRYPRGASKSVTFTKAGIVQVFCHIHSDMSAIVFVLANPFFARPEPTGRYEIADVPPGDYTVVGWHERTRPVTQRIRVVAGQATTVNFNLPLTTPAQP